MQKHSHYWLPTGEPSPFVFLNGKWKYECSVCGKVKYFCEQPINPLVPSAWNVYKGEVARGNTHLVMAPLMTVGHESQYAEGQRYAELVRTGQKE